MTTTITDHIYHMRRHFRSGATRSLESRKRRLESLRQIILKNESAILEALAKDLGKSPFEAYSSEISVVLQEIKLATQKLEEWASPVSVATPITVFPAKASIIPQPKGLVLNHWALELSFSIDYGTFGGRTCCRQCRRA